MRRILQIIYTRKSVIITAFVTVVLVTAIFTLLTPPTYRSTAKVYAEQKKEEHIFAFTTNASSDLEIFLQTQMEMILSHSVAERTVNKLRLEENFKGPHALARAISDLQRRTTVSSRLGPKEEPSESIMGRSNIILVSVDASDPQEAALTANTLCEIYREFFFEVKGVQAREVYVFLKDQLTQVSRKIDTAEQNLREFEASVGQDIVELMTLERGLFKPFGELERLWGQYQQSRARFEGARARVEDIKKQLDNQEDPIVPAKSWFHNQSLIMTKKDVLGMEAKLAELTSRYTPEYKPIPQAQEQLGDLERILNREIRKDIDGDFVDAHRDMLESEAETVTLGTVVSDYPERLENMVMKRADFVRLQRDLTAREKIYLDMIEQVHDARVAMYSDLRKVANIYIMDRAIPPLGKLKPKTKLNLIIATFVGLLLGLGLAFLADFIDHTVKTIEDIDIYVKQPLLISLPFLSREKRESR